MLRNHTMGQILDIQIINHSHIFLLHAEEYYGESIKCICFEAEIWYSWTDNKKQMKKYSNTRMFAQGKISLGMGIRTPIAMKLIDLGRSRTKPCSCFGFFPF